MQPVSAWIEANPVLFSAFVWPTVTALVTWFFRAHSEDDYKRLPKWLATVVRVSSSIGFDAPAALDAAKKAFPKKGGGVPPILGVIFALILSACAMFNPNNMNVVGDIAKAAACVETHSNETPAEIVRDCGEYGIKSVADVISILQTQERAIRRSQRCSSKAFDGDAGALDGASRD